MWPGSNFGSFKSVESKMHGMFCNHLLFSVTCQLMNKNIITSNFPTLVTLIRTLILAFIPSYVLVSLCRIILASGHASSALFAACKSYYMIKSHMIHVQAPPVVTPVLVSKLDPDEAYWTNNGLEHQNLLLCWSFVLLWNVSPR